MGVWAVYSVQAAAVVVAAGGEVGVERIQVL
jgi:hypothetical protein